MSGSGQSVKRRREAGSEAVAAAPPPPARTPGALVRAALAAEEAWLVTAAASTAAKDAAVLAERDLTYLPPENTLSEADGRVVAANGAALPVHRQVLLLASPVLREAMLSSGDTVRTLVRAAAKVA